MIRRFLVAIAATTVAAAAARAETVITVGATGSQHTSVQAAIDAASEGATVRVAAGEYDGDLVIRKRLTLEGVGWDKTTIVALQPTAEHLAEAARDLERQVRSAPQQDQRRLVEQHAQRLLRPAVRVEAAQGVIIRNLKIAAQPVSTDNRFGRSPGVLLLISGAKAEVDGCAIVGSPGDGVHVTAGADATLRRCLVAGNWGEGIVVGGRDPAVCRATIRDSDVRNVYHYGILIARGHHATVERCRISGTAWHGVRYDDASPTLTANHIFANARSGIYASGKTSATIKDNLFTHNEMDAISCWFFNRDTIAGNTFADNANSGVVVLGESAPTIEANVFVGEKIGIASSGISGNAPGANAVGQPMLRNNLFWKTDAPVALAAWEKDKGREAPSWVKLDEGAGNKVADAPPADAAAHPAHTDSPFPLQPQEKAIIPDGARHDYTLWKRPALEPLRVAALPPAPAAPAVEKVSYEKAFTDLYEVLGRDYPCFELKNIDWAAVGRELLPRAKEARDEREFGLLVMELVARLQDSHALVGPGSAQPPTPEFPTWDPGLACLIDDRGKPVVYYTDPNGPADKAAIKRGTTILSIDGKPVEQALAERMKELSRYSGYSSDRYLRYHAAQFLPRVMRQGANVILEVEDIAGEQRRLELPATLRVRYLPRLPVPIKGIADSANVSWTMLEGNIGYVYVRRIGNDLVDQLDRAVGALKDARGLIVDVRGNSGGGFDAERSFRNFDPSDAHEPARPRFAGKIAVLIDARCISAGEGWASWFVANRRARFFGEATAGASSRKQQYTLANGLYTVTYPVKAYTGFLDRPIERRGLEPDEKVKQNAQDLAAGKDTVLEAAKRHLSEPR